MLEREENGLKIGVQAGENREKTRTATVYTCAVLKYGQNIKEDVSLSSWTVYILECADGSLYTGITNDLPNRIAAHESGTGAKYTRGRAPFKLAYTENCNSRSHASKREMEIKALKRADKPRTQDFF